MNSNNTTSQHQPTITVIVPVFNTETSIKRCLESIQAQTFSDYEVLIIDDGTPDQAIKIANNVIKDDPRFIVISQTNQGLGAARNTGLKHASGKFISCIDSDDTISPFMFEKMLEIANETSAEIVVCEADNLLFTNGEFDHSLGAYKMAGNEKIISGRTALERQLNYIEPILFNSVCFKLIRRSVFLKNEIWFPENYRYSEDTPTSVALFLQAEKVALVHEPLYNYIHENDSLTSSYSLKKAEDLLLNMKEIEEMVAKKTKKIALDNFFIGLLFPLTKQILFSNSKEKDRIAALESQIRTIQQNYKPNLSYPKGIPFVQKIKILVSYHNLAKPICNILSHFTSIPFVKHML